MKTAAAFLMVALGVPGVAGQSAAAPPHPGDNAEPKTAVGWFLRADQLTNIRMPGSPAFHMKVSFHAYPGIDFAPPGKSPIQTGGGTYQEWWLSPERWRREITFGAYHAVEVGADGVRRFQASSDYEPSRVLFLLQALLQPVPRHLLEPELEDPAEKDAPSQRSGYYFGGARGWKVERRDARGLPYVELNWRVDDPQCAPVVATWDLLPSGLPIRVTNVFRLTTTWQDQILFGAREVPRHIEVLALERRIVAADAAIEALSQPDSGLFRLDGEAAEPGMTLRPPDEWEVRYSGWFTARYRLPADPPENYPAHVRTMVIAIVDRRGVPREPEVTGIYDEGQPLSDSQKEAIWAAAQEAVATLPNVRFKPALVEGSPIETIDSMQPCGGRGTVQTF